MQPGDKQDQASRIEWLVEQQARFDARLERIENSILFRMLRAVGLFATAQKRKLGQALLHSPLHPLLREVSGQPRITREYAEWLSRHVALPPRIGSYQPLISVVMAVHDPQPKWLEEAVESVFAQSYPKWQLCICDDLSQVEAVRAYLEGLPQRESRVAVDFRERPGGISGAMNRAAQLAGGEYLAFLDHDDRLAADALAQVAGALQERRYELLYSDEEHIDEEGRRLRPRFKPGWSPKLLIECMYMGHLLVVRRDSFELAGGFRSEFDGAQDFDLVLRVTDRPVTVRHISEVLYSWREHSGSTAQSAGAKPYTHEAGERALADTLARRGETGEISRGDLPNSFRIRRRREAVSTSLVICSRSPGLLEPCLRGLRERTSGAQLEIVVVHHETGTPADARLEAVVARFDARRIAYSDEFHFSRMNNLGARAAGGQALVFLNDDVDPLDPGWLEALLEQVACTEVGIAGAKLLYPNGTLQHAGIAVGIMDGAGHPGRGLIRSDTWPWLEATREVSAVTGACLAVRREVFEQLGGFDEQFPVNYNDVDFCLRARQAGYVVMLESRAVLRHAEGQTRGGGTRYTERQAFCERWGRLLAEPDPYYCQHLSRVREDTALGD